jgi:Uma2 family endonuclease
MEQTMERRRMSLAEFDALPREVRAEYVDGTAIVTPPARDTHGWVADEVRGLLRAAGLVAVREAGITYPPGIKRRIPDVTVLPRLSGAIWSEERPLLVVEVLSPTTRSEDLLRKPAEYLRAGIGQYWLLDPESRTLTVLVNGGEAWETLLELDEELPAGEVEVGDVIVPVDLQALLAGL